MERERETTSNNKAPVKQGLILKESGWHLIERLPEEPIKPGSWAHQEFFEEYYEDKAKYNKAIDGAIPVHIDGSITMLVMDGKLHGQPEEGKVYPVEVEYEIVEISSADGSESEKFAILHPKQKEEGQDIIWEECLSLIDEKARDIDSYEYGLPRYEDPKGKSIKEFVMEKFHIVRKVEHGK